MATPVSNDSTAALSGNKTTHGEANGSATATHKPATTLEKPEQVISYADTTDLSVAGHLLSTQTTAPAPGPVGSSLQAAQLAIAVHSAIANNSSQAIKAQAGNASPDLVLLLGSK